MLGSIPNGADRSDGGVVFLFLYWLGVRVRYGKCVPER